MSDKTVHKVLHASGAELASDDGANVNCKADAGAVYLDVTGVAGSPDTLDVVIEEYAGGNWYQIAAFAQVTDTLVTERIALTGFFGNVLRASWVVSSGASSPGFTFEVLFAGEET